MKGVIKEQHECLPKYFRLKHNPPPLDKWKAERVCIKTGITLYTLLFLNNILIK